MSKKLQKAVKKWREAKAELDKAKELEFSLRMKVQDLMAEDKIKVDFDDEEIDFRKSKNYSIPAASFPSIKSGLPKDVFDSSFSVSYKLKPAVYDKLDKKHKKVIDNHLQIKDAPLSVSIKVK